MRSISARRALALATGVASVVFVAGAAAHTDSGARAAAALKEGGTITIGMANGEPDVLDPTLARTFSGREVFTTFCEKLYDLNAKAQIVPELAAALPAVSKDKVTVTIKLRRGIMFNDGTPFNAEAVVKSLQREQTLQIYART